MNDTKLTPGAHNSGSRKTPYTPVNASGTAETGRGAVKQSAIKAQKANPVGKLSKKECTYQKTTFTPGGSGRNGRPNV